MGDFRRISECVDPLEVLMKPMEAGLVPEPSYLEGRWSRNFDRPIETGDSLDVSVFYPDDRLGPLKVGQDEADLPYMAGIYPDLWPGLVLGDASLSEPTRRIRGFQWTVGASPAAIQELLTGLRLDELPEKGGESKRVRNALRCIVGLRPHDVATRIERLLTDHDRWGSPRFDIVNRSDFEIEAVAQSPVDRCEDELCDRYVAALKIIGGSRLSTQTRRIAYSPPLDSAEVGVWLELLATRFQGLCLHSALEGYEKLNSYGHQSPEKKRRRDVLEFAMETGFTPNRSARHLVEEGGGKGCGGELPPALARKFARRVYSGELMTPEWQEKLSTGSAAEKQVGLNSTQKRALEAGRTDVPVNATQLQHLAKSVAKRTEHPWPRGLFVSNFDSEVLLRSAAESAFQRAYRSVMVLHRQAIIGDPSANWIFA